MIKPDLKKKDIIYRHIIVWFLFIIYELSYIYLVTGALGSFLSFALYYTINILLLYANAYFLEYSYKKKHKYFWMLLIIISEFIVYQALRYLIAYFLISIGNIPKNSLDNPKLFIIQSIYRAIYFLGFSIAYWFARSINKQRKQIQELIDSKLIQERLSAEMERNLMQAQTAYLQAQLNPHLLFNTLNFIYNSVRKLSESAASAILLLAEMMRYSLSNVGDDGKVDLQKEIDHIGNLVKINQLRFNEKLNMNITLNGDFSEETVIPLLLLSFVENIYKHGDLTDPTLPAEVIITCEKHHLTMRFSNKKKKHNFNEGWGVGIKNAQMRLNIYYPGIHSIAIKETETMYNFKLELLLQ
jgi:two-component system LytT family sensor kinase